MNDIPKAELAKAGGPDITRLLQPGEQVLWQGQSKPIMGSSGAGLFRRTDEPAPPMSRYWIDATGLTLIAAGVVVPVAYIMMNGFYLPDLLIIMLMFLVFAGTGSLIRWIGRSGIAAEHSNYWLTNLHAIIIRKPPFRSDDITTVIELAATDAVKMIERGDGSGTLVFGRNAISAYSPTTRSYARNEEDYSFSDIPNVVEVYRMVQEAQDGMQKAQGA